MPVSIEEACYIVSRQWSSVCHRFHLLRHMRERTVRRVPLNVGVFLQLVMIRFIMLAILYGEKTHIKKRNLKLL